MKSEDNFPWGAKIERGKVTAARENENTAYRYDVDSIDRPGVTVHDLTAMGGVYAAGSAVYFFTFEDGKGMILGGII